MACGVSCKRVQMPPVLRSWPWLQLPPWLAAFVAVIALADIAAIVTASGDITLSLGNLLLFGLLLACSAVTVEMTRRIGEPALFFQDMCGVWELPAAVLLPPALAMLAPLPRVAMMQWRIRRIDPHRRVFSAASISLSYGLISVLFHLQTGHADHLPTDSPAAAGRWIVAVAACGVLQWTLNNSLIMVAVKGSDRSASIRRTMLGRQNLHNDLTEVSVAVVVTTALAVSPVVLIFALPFVGLLQRSLRHAQLLDAARVDAKTGVLNAQTWHREASLELARAQRTGAGLALALIDLDHFKAVNDTHGHLAGDDALRAVCQAINRAVREYDLVGRFGGEEFSLLMPQTTAAGGLAVAERIRAGVAALLIESAAAIGGGTMQLTVSIGVAAASGASADLTKLLAAADACLYQAKADGRNQVQLAAGEPAVIEQPAALPA